MNTPDLRYEVLLYWSNDDGAYIAEVPGCVSDGETHAQAAANAEDAMRAWIETAQALGREVPVPKGRRLRFA